MRVLLWGGGKEERDALAAATSTTPAAAVALAAVLYYDGSCCCCWRVFQLPHHPNMGAGGDQRCANPSGEGYRILKANIYIVLVH
jgi:hypothetical protein